MTLEPERRNQLDHAWMESLLVECESNPAENEERIQSLLNQLNSKSPPNVSIPMRKISTWVPLAIAATIVLMVSGWWLIVPNTQNAYAALARSQKPFPQTREYKIHIRATSPRGQLLERDVELFIDSKNRIAVHSRGWLGSDLWHGDNGTQKWLVPRLGPAFLGDRRIVNKWLSEKDDSESYLHIQTILERMAQGYQLQTLSDESVPIPGGIQSALCDHIRGSVTPGAVQRFPNLPDSIDLWADKESGIARRLALNWNRKPQETGPIEWQIELQGFPNLPADWFEPGGHMRPNQRIIQARSVSDFDASQKEMEP